MIQPLCLLPLLVLAASPQMRSGEDVLRAMHERHSQTTIGPLVLIQSVVYFDPGSGRPDRAEIRYQSMDLPGMVRSDVAPLDDRVTELFRNDSIFRMRGDSVAVARPSFHPVLLLGFDAYTQPLSQTVHTLERIGIDLNRLREDEWQGRPVWVVGSSSPGDRANQFWMDKESLLFLRLITTDGSTGVVREIRFRDHQPLGGSRIPTVVEFYVDGRLTITERSTYWATDVELPRSLFALERRSRPTWVRH